MSQNLKKHKFLQPQGKDTQTGDGGFLHHKTWKSQKVGELEDLKKTATSFEGRWGNIFLGAETGADCFFLLNVNGVIISKWIFQPP